MLFRVFEGRGEGGDIPMFLANLLPPDSLEAAPAGGGSVGEGTDRCKGA